MVVSVVVPVWGDYAGERLDGALASLRAQEVPCRLVLVDNADDPPLAREGATVVRSEARLSVGAARDLGLRSVTTPYVLFWDADDEMLPGTLVRLLAVLEARPEVVACGTSMLDDRTGLPHHWPRAGPMRLSRRRTTFAVLNAVISLFPSTGTLIRTGPAKDAGLPDADAGDDWAFGASLAFRGRIALDPHLGRLYHRDPRSVSAHWSRHHVLDAARLVRVQIREDPEAPAAARRLLPAIWLGQQLVLRVLRPLARRTPRRRRAGT